MPFEQHTTMNYLVESNQNKSQIHKIQKLLFVIAFALCSSSAEAALWTPTQVTTTQWYDASDAATITHSSGAVSQWSTKTGASHLTQGTGSLRPVWGSRTINGTATVEFDGVDDRMVMTNIILASGNQSALREIWATIELDDTTNEPILGSVTGSNQAAIVSNALRLEATPLGPYPTNNASSTLPSSPLVIGFIGDATKKYSINGTLESTTDTVAGGINRIQSNQVGYRTVQAQGFDGLMGELIIKPISTIDTRRRMEGYMAHKWGLQGNLPINHVYKVYAPTTDSITMSFDTTGGSAVASIIDIFGSTITTSPSNPARTGYTFSSWSSTIPDTIPYSSTNYTAQWTANPYDVIFDVNGGSGSMANQTITFDQSANLVANTFTKSEHTFSGWNTSVDGSGTSYADGALLIMNTTGKTLYAQWAINQYTITLDSNGGSAITPITQGYNTAVTAPTSPTRTGYVFDGWSPSLPVTMPASSNTHTAQWIPNSYSVAFMGNGSTSGTMSDQSFAYDVAQSLTANAYTKSGYVFAGWNTVADGSGTAYSNSQSVSSIIASGTAQLYAQWSLAPVTGSSSSGSGGGGPRPCSPGVTAFCQAKLVTIPAQPVLNTKDTLCPKDQILTQNLRAPSRNGKYNAYTRGIVTQANKLQAHLYRLGFNSGAVDGILGPASMRAIKRMQIFLETTPDGYIGPATRERLNNSCGNTG